MSHQNNIRLKKLFAVIPVLFTCCVTAQNNDDIIIGKRESIYSDTLSEKRTFLVYSPGFTSQNVGPQKRYPVLYLLDGSAHFYSTVGIIQQLSQANGNGVLPEMMVVAIESTNRMKDFVPSTDPTTPNRFVQFLKSELIPHVEKHYPTAPYRLIAGHSLGGLLVIDFLTQEPALFNAYIAIDPSMWYANEVFLKRTISHFPAKNLKSKSLFLGVANTLPVGVHLSQVRKDQSAETRHLRSILRLDDFLKKNAAALYYADKFYDRERHNTVPLLTIYDGLRFIFDFYYFDASEKDFLDSTASIAHKLRTHYANVSARLGYQNAAPESLVNYIAFEALKSKHHRKAEALLKLNVEWYPNSFRSFDALADYYMELNDSASAIEYYKKALSLEANELTAGKLAAIIRSGKLVDSTVDLKRYVGVYNLEQYNILILLEVRGNSLWAKVPGQADDEFQMLSENVFTVKGKQGYHIKFEMDADKPKGFVSVQPNGTFKAVFKSR